ncbi:hypothetical protein GIB67_013834 [Kingdonia uniflora]|uniref:SCP domain-containing protein n=1 Tax=Kingdonia uniflora TaxID=39325 RepID=A0A7J7N3R1_9MAGN|nr:hypothetical protein GIB67_013834 [Kingdonia uniflora]
MLDGHNEARNAVGVPPLRWDQRLAIHARFYSNQRRKDCQLIHSPWFGFGENLFWGQGRQWTAKDAVDTWVGEKKLYNYDSNSCTGETCGHYTQIVWRTTKRVGCSRITCNSGNAFIACEYFPPGNYIGLRPY